ncbi:MAG: MATE family efflux transporter [Planctomycetia bacterium]|nr:MATE family efflux transporter [Planctomycetia bacterium]
MPHELTPRPAARLRSWWNGEAGLREALVISVPLVISSLSWTVMNFIDRLFLLSYSEDAVAAALPAGIMAFAVICFPLGIASYASTFVAQYFGAGRLRQIGPMVWQAMWLGIITVPLAIAVIPLAPALFRSFGGSEAIVQSEFDYFRTLSYSGGAMVLSAALSAFFSGRGNVRVVMVVDTLAAVVNVVLDYAWIFGKWGFPESGIAGAGWATTVAIWFKTIVYLVLFLRPQFQEQFATLSGRRFDLDMMKRLFRYGVAGGMQMQLEVFAFGSFTLLVGGLGQHALAATSLAFNVNNFAFMPIWGIGMATSTMVGRRLGEERPELATRAVWSCMAWGLLYMGAICLFYVVFPQLVLWPHRQFKMEGHDFAELEAETIVLLRFVAAFGLFDAVNILFAGALKGAGDVKFVLVGSVAIAAFSVAVTKLGLMQGLGLYWCWYVLTAWVVLLAALFRHRFLHGPWRSMRVIEPQG